MAKKKYKEMTCKEFKEAFNNLYGKFDIWKWDGILNALACLAGYQEKELLQSGCVHAAAAEKARHDNIMLYLMDRGYYSADNQ